MPATKEQTYSIRRSSKGADGSYTTIECGETHYVLPGEDPIQTYAALREKCLQRFLGDMKAFGIVK